MQTLQLLLKLWRLQEEVLQLIDLSEGVRLNNTMVTNRCKCKLRIYMAEIVVQGQTFKIKGTEPTPKEQVAIDTVLAAKEI